MKPALLAFLFLPLALSAADISLTDGSVLKDADVLRRDGEQAIIRHSGGIRRVAHDLLPAHIQEKYELTPELVLQRRTAAQEAQTRQQEDLRRRQEATRAALTAAGLQPRYLTAADVLTLYGPLHNITVRQAEYLAAEWNRREAERLDLPLEAQVYAAAAARVEGSFRADREAFLERLDAADELRTRVTTLTEQNKALREAYAQLKKQNEALIKELDDLPDSLPRTSPTIIVPPRPIYIPPRPAVRPSVRPAVRPAVRPHPHPPVRPPQPPPPPRK